jgi:hypothetical protein
MGQLERYHGIDAAHQHSVYTLAWRLCRNEETAVKGFIPTAVDIAYKSVRRRDRRMRASDTRLTQSGVVAGVVITCVIRSG